MKWRISRKGLKKMVRNKMKDKLKFILAPIAVLLLSGFVQSDNDVYFKMSKSIDIFGKVYKEINLNYVDNVDPEEFMLSGIKGMLHSLDPYTMYIDENLQKDVDLMTIGRYGGIGATVGLRNDEVIIVDLLEGYSAQRQGIRIGDVITQVNDVKISRDNYDDLSKYMQGSPGTTVKINIKRDGSNDDLVFNLIREEIEVKNLTYYGFIPKESNNVYLKLSGFGRSSGKEVEKALKELKKEKEIKSIILDLRGNPGGLLDAAIDVSEKFVGKGQLVVSVIGRDTTDITEYYSEEEPVAGESKLAVLVDGGTASAAEIVTGAVQDHDRGVVIGTPSFGKGLVQTVVPLSYNTSLKITTGKYYTPSGRCIQKIDYAKNNKIVQPIINVTKATFHTDNNRTVYSGGGLYPDSLVKNSSESSQVINLLARGMFFQFATKYSNRNEIINLDDVSHEDLYKEFLDYLKDQNYEYHSQTSKLLTQLEKAAEKEEIYSSLKDDIEKLNLKTDKILSEQLLIHKDEIVSEIEKELATRIAGREGRIKASLQNDKQFEAAYDILNSEKLYGKFLISKN